ncbi:MAG: GNAT family N-acetyltransferase [Clostridia bacterium]|nr:GNAT family N-acetyltransferase [Clostridium sp.]MBS6252001.1 GNAT family N-acetyltransferase [Clostridium sp.]
MKLREIIQEDKEKIIEMYKEYVQSELIPGIDRFEGIRDLEKLEKLDFEVWLEELEKKKSEKNLPKTYSPQTLYLAINDNDEIVGAIGIRWKQVPALMTFGGLIGYSIRPKQRRKGYASEMLKLALDKLKNTNLENVLITCKDFNIASKKVIEKNGGIFENTYNNIDDGYTYLRYWIKI